MSPPGACRSTAKAKDRLLQRNASAHPNNLSRIPLRGPMGHSFSMGFQWDTHQLFHGVPHHHLHIAPTIPGHHQARTPRSGAMAGRRTLWLEKRYKGLIRVVVERKGRNMCWLLATSAVGSRDRGSGKLWLRLPPFLLLWAFLVERTHGSNMLLCVTV